MPKKSFKKYNRNQQQEKSVLDTMSKKELIEYAAEQLAWLFWETWLYKKKNKNPKDKEH